MSSFDPKLQNFTITGSDGVTVIPISIAVIDAQRVRLANICISYGVQLGLCLATLMVVLLLVPAAKLRRQAIHAVHISSLVVAVIRLVLLLQYFPGPLSEYYVSWTRDAHALSWPSDYEANTAGNTFNVVQFALIEAALIMQSWNLMRTWSPGAWPRFVKLTSIALAMCTIAVKSAWVAHHTWALRESTLPVTLDGVGQAATVLGAVSIFYFCGIFFLHLMIHLFLTRGVLSRPERGLTSLEILAIGNGTLMVLPSKYSLAAGTLQAEKTHYLTCEP
jgi:pheromone alpha factor receptor